MFLSTFSRLGKIEGAISGLANKINGGGGAGGGGGGGGKSFCLNLSFTFLHPDSSFHIIWMYHRRFQTLFLQLFENLRLF